MHSHVQSCKLVHISGINPPAWILIALRTQTVFLTLYIHSLLFFLCSFLWQLHFTLAYKIEWDFPGGSVIKNPTSNAGDASFIPGLGRSPGEGNGNPFQYSCLGKSQGQRSLVGYSPWGHKESDMTEWLNLTELRACPHMQSHTHTHTHTHTHIWKHAPDMVTKNFASCNLHFFVHMLFSC